MEKSGPEVSGTESGSGGGLKLTPEMFELEGAEPRFAQAVKEAFCERINASEELRLELEIMLATAQTEFLQLILKGSSECA